MNVELVHDARAEIGEGPIWDDRTRLLHWVDIPAGIVHRFSPEDGVHRPINVGQPIGAFALGQAGGLVLALRGGFGFLPAASERVETVLPVEPDRPGNRMNDGRCDPAGRFWAGTMSSERLPGAGSLYRLDWKSERLDITRMLEGLTIANGIDWSPNGRLMYYIDSPTQRVDVFDFDVESGAISNRRAFAAIPQSEGLPDGLVVDGEGGVWVALFWSGRVRRYTPNGEIKQEIELPVTLVTSASFGGPDLGDLYITTARHRLTPEERAQQVHAGGLYRCRPGPVGKQANRFPGI
jgi:sugar lactone lactonase YvrE